MPALSGASELCITHAYYTCLRSRLLNLGLGVPGLEICGPGSAVFCFSERHCSGSVFLEDDSMIWQKIGLWLSCGVPLTLLWGTVFSTSFVCSLGLGAEGLRSESPGQGPRSRSPLQRSGSHACTHTRPGLPRVKAVGLGAGCGVALRAGGPSPGRDGPHSTSLQEKYSGGGLQWVRGPLGRWGSPVRTLLRAEAKRGPEEQEETGWDMR